jgi:SAM-dependent methyltransferase
VEEPDPNALGYHCVDGSVDIPVLLDTMDATGGWPATAELRAWERERLRLRPGERLLDVGCGLGAAGLELAVDLGANGKLVGVDASAAMVDVARNRARTARCRVRFSVGDAHQLVEPDGSFDAARSERTLQWLADPGRAVAELVRVLQPGGRLCLTDTDWSTLRLDIGDEAVEAKVSSAFREERGRPSNVGRRVAVLAERAGCTVSGERTATHRWTSWDPDTELVPPGCFSMRSLAHDLVERGELAASESEGFVERIHEAARRGRFSMSLTMHAAVAKTPGV